MFVQFQSRFVGMIKYDRRLRYLYRYHQLTLFDDRCRLLKILEVGQDVYSDNSYLCTVPEEEYSGDDLLPLRKQYHYYRGNRLLVENRDEEVVVSDKDGNVKSYTFKCDDINHYFFVVDTLCYFLVDGELTRFYSCIDGSSIWQINQRVKSVLTSKRFLYLHTDKGLIRYRLRIEK
jgi:hypothetical protein